MSLQIEHAAFAHRFLLVVEEQRCVLDYEVNADVLTIQSIRVPESVSGRGIAASMTRAALLWARQQGLQLRPHCAYVLRFVEIHPEFADLLQRAEH